MKEKSRKVKMKRSVGDYAISVITYIVYALFALVCAYPFYYIFVNTISANDLSDKGRFFSGPRASISPITSMPSRFRGCCRRPRFRWPGRSSELPSRC